MDNADQRVAALNDYEIMDTPPEQEFDDLTRLTSFICDTPIALVTLLDQRRQWFKSAVGLSGTETPLEHAFCAHAIQQEKVFTVHDASLDIRFSTNPLVTGAPNIRFYAGAPLTTPSGIAIGTLCAIDRKPRSLSPEQQAALAALARQVIQSLEFRKKIKDLHLALTEKRAAEQEVAQLQGLLPMCGWCHKVRDEKTFWQSVEQYLASHSTLRISHGMCPECVKKWENELKNKKADKTGKS